MLVNRRRHQNCFYSVLLVCFSNWTKFPHPFYVNLIHGELELSWIRTSHVQGLVWSSRFFFIYFHVLWYMHYHYIFCFLGLKESIGQWGQKRKTYSISLHLYSPCLYWITESCSSVFFVIIMLFLLCLMSLAAKMSAWIDGVECVMGKAR